MRCDLLNPYAVVKEHKALGESPGDGRDRTGDLLLAKQALSQLSYVPSGSGCVSGQSQESPALRDVPEKPKIASLMGASGIEPLTPALSARCSTN